MSERTNGSRSVKTPIYGKSRTKQAFKGECDINKIVAKATQTGFVDSMNGTPPMYADVSDVPDYQTSLNVVIYAKKRFDALPAEVRRRFGNNPNELVEFMGNEENREEAVKLGLLPKPPKAPKEVIKNDPPKKVDAGSGASKPPPSGSEPTPKV